MPSATSTKLYLPDFIAMCPFELGSSNPHFKEASAASNAWVNSFNLFNDRKRAFFVQGCCELLVSRAYPYAPFEEFRTCCDFVNALFVIDEVSDDQHAEEAKQTGGVFLNVMYNPTWDDGSALSCLFREFRARLTSWEGKASFQRFLVNTQDYIDAVSKEVELRDEGKVLDLDAYILLRRENSAVKYCFGLFEYCLGIDLPEEVFQNPTFTNFYNAAVDLICWSNDVYSFNVEQSMGHANNIVCVLMQEKNMTIQEAFDYVGVQFQRIMDIMLEEKKRLPSWGPEIDAAVARYVEATEYWVVANLEWSFETPRYFGPEHDEIGRTLTITLRPRVNHLD